MRRSSFPKAQPFEPSKQSLSQHGCSRWIPHSLRFMTHRSKVFLLDCLEGSNIKVFSISLLFLSSTFLFAIETGDAALDKKIDATSAYSKKLTKKSKDKFTKHWEDDNTIQKEIEERERRSKEGRTIFKNMLNIKNLDE